MGLLECPSSSLSMCVATLNRTQIEDESTMNIAGKRFILTKLNVNQSITHESVTFLTPYLRHLQSLHIGVSYTTIDCSDLMQAFGELNSCALTSFIALNVSCGFLFPFLHAHNLRQIELRLDRCVEEMEVLALAAQCPLLESISLHNSQLSEGVIALLLKCCLHLKSLTLHSEIISDLIIAKVFHGMHSLSLSHETHGESTFKWSTKRSLRCCEAILLPCMNKQRYLSIFSLNPDLITIDLGGCACLNDDLLAALVTRCPLLQGVGLGQSPLVSAEGFLHLSKLIGLNSVKVECMMNLTDSVLDTILRGKSIRRLEFITCSGITRNALHLIAKCCPTLTHLTMLGQDDVTSSEVIVLLEGCRTLQYLNLSKCIQVTSEICEALKEHRPMRYLDVRGCKISKHAIQELVKSGFHCPQLLFDLC